MKNSENPPETFPVEKMPEVPAQRDNCDTAKKIFNCLQFPLRDFTKANQKTAWLKKPADKVESEEKGFTTAPEGHHKLIVDMKSPIEAPYNIN